MPINSGPTWKRFFAVTEYKAPAPYPVDKPIVFLAGTIDMGNSADWQKEFVEMVDSKFLTILNPRRDDWDSSWKQDIDDVQFYEQVSWELAGLEEADAIVMYLAPGSASPISLLELGLFAKSKKMIVICPEGFYRKGNVDIVCHTYGVTQVNSIREAAMMVYIITQKAQEILNDV